MNGQPNLSNFTQWFKNQTIALSVPPNQNTAKDNSFTCVERPPVFQAVRTPEHC